MSRSRPRIRSLVVVVVALSCAGCGGSSGGEDVVARAPADVPTASTTGTRNDGAESALAGEAPTSSDPGIVVDVAGAVRRPGVYRMAPGARVHEAIQAAGGARRGASLGGLNRAAVLVDGQQVLVASAESGSAGHASGSVGAAGAGAGAGGMVNINSADVAGLDALPGIGEVTAGKIVASREEAGPFATLDDLDRVPGIGPTMIESLRTAATT